MHSKELLKKLVKVERTINIYKKENNILSDEIVIIISIEDLKIIIKAEHGDPELYLGYIIDATALALINKLLDRKIKVDFANYKYYLVCTGIYSN